MTTAVLVCGEGLLGDDSGLPGAVVVADLCSQPEPISDLVAAGVDRLVLGLCDGRTSLGHIQREARRVGLDPLGIESVDLEDADGDLARLDLMLAGATARAETFAGSRPQQTKMTFPGQTSRRALLTFSPPEYQPAPAIDESRCAAARGCRACLEVCPRDALTFLGGRVRHDLTKCAPCGRCVTICPTAAVENPAATPQQVEAQMRALLDISHGPAGPRGIVYRCQRSDRAETAPGWYPVTVPCTGMLTPVWLLAPLLLGAGSVAVRHCAVGGCPLKNDDLVVERMAWCQGFLAGIGGSPARLSTDAELDAPLEPLAAMAVSDPFGPLGAASVLIALTDATGANDLQLAQPESPLGLIDIDARSCTGCGTCTTACPTGALLTTDENEGRSITFDAARCVACGLCVSRCPEVERGAISLRSTVDTNRLRQGRMQLLESDLIRCHSCGDSLAPAPLLDRVAELLGDEQMLAALSRSCPDCRSVAAIV